MSNPFANWTMAQAQAHNARVMEHRARLKFYEQTNNPLGALETDSPKPTPAKALDRGARVKKSRAGCLVRVRMVTLRHRLLDPDAVAFSCKPLTDLIAADLRVDDADPRVEWEWAQVKCTGEEGVIVIIEEVKP